MERIKGIVAEVLAADTLLIEVAFVGNFNQRGLPGLVKVRFEALSPPFLKGVPPEQAIDVLNKTLLGQRVAANIGNPDASGVFRGKVTCDGPYYRRKKKFL